jgi:uncharacterized protein (DUF362 family)
MLPRMNRRRFLHTLACSAAGASAWLPDHSAMGVERKQFRVPRILRNPDEPSRVAIIKGDDRKHNMMEALDLIKDDIRRGIGNKQVVIKVNFTASVEKADTHVDAVRAICETISPFYKKPIIVSEGQSRDVPVEDDYEHFGFYELPKEYNVVLHDEWMEPFSPLTIVDHRWQMQPVQVCEMYRDPNVYLISAAVLKRHASAVVTLSLKNVLMASIWYHDGLNQRKLMHVPGSRDDKALYARQFALNQYLIGMHTAPDLAVIDGFAGMEIAEVYGKLVDHRVAIAGTDFLAADRVGAALMGVEFEHIGTLNHCYNAGMGEADLRNIDILGHSLSECRKEYAEKPGAEYMRYHWRL